MSSTHAHFLGSDKFLMCMLGAPGAVFFLLDCVLDKLVLGGGGGKDGGCEELKN